MRNIHTFSAELPSATKLRTIVEQASEKRSVYFEDCMPTQLSSFGFDGVNFDLPLSNGYMMTFVHEAKKLSMKAIKQEVDRRIKAHEESTLEKLTKKQIGELKELVIKDFCMSAPTETDHVIAFYHTKEQLLIVDATEKLAQRVVNQLILAIGSLETKTLWCSSVSNSLTDNLANFSKHGQSQLTIDGFEYKDKLVLSNQEKDKVSFKGDYPLEEVESLIDQGYFVKEVSLLGNDIEFTLTDDFKVKRITPHFEFDDEEFEDKQAYDEHFYSVFLEFVVNNLVKLKAQFDKLEEKEAA